MGALGYASLTFVGAFGGVLFGTYLRSHLPSDHLSKESQDVMRLGMGLVATMTALLLGLVTASARSSFDSQDTAVRTIAADVLALDRLLARYGAEAGPARQLLRQRLALQVETIWPGDGSTGTGLAKAPAAPVAEEVETRILDLAPETDRQRWLKDEALKLSEEVLRTRWRVLGSQGGSVPFVFLVVVIFWLTVIFGSFGLYTQRNASVVAVLFVAALSVAAAVFLIIELDSPFDGLIRIPGGPMRYALSQIGR